MCDFFVADADVKGFFQECHQAEDPHRIDDAVLGEHFLVCDLVDALGLREFFDNVLANLVFHRC